MKITLYLCQKKLNLDYFSDATSTLSSHDKHHYFLPSVCLWLSPFFLHSIFSYSSPVEENYFFKKKLKVFFEKTLHHFVIVIYYNNFGFCLNTISYCDCYAKYINWTKYFISFISYLFFKPIPFPMCIFFFYESLWTISSFRFVHMNICLFCPQPLTKKKKLVWQFSLSTLKILHSCHLKSIRISLIFLFGALLILSGSL